MSFSIGAPTIRLRTQRGGAWELIKITAGPFRFSEEYSKAKQEFGTFVVKQLPTSPLVETERCLEEACEADIAIGETCALLINYPVHCSGKNQIDYINSAELTQKLRTSSRYEATLLELTFEFELTRRERDIDQKRLSELLGE